MVLQVDGIDPVGRTDWVDGDAKRTVMLLYFDRPAAITGGNFAIHATAGGYVWVGLRPGAQGEVYTVIPTPARLLLAVISGVPAR